MLVPKVVEMHEYAPLYWSPSCWIYDGVFVAIWNPVCIAQNGPLQIYRYGSFVLLASTVAENVFLHEEGPTICVDG